MTASLERPGADHIDPLYIHRSDPQARVEKVVG